MIESAASGERETDGKDEGKCNQGSCLCMTTNIAHTCVPMPAAHTEVACHHHKRERACLRFTAKGLL